MTNDNKEVFAIKTVQSLLREVSLYGGRIDGLFGKTCRSAFVTLLQAFNPTRNPTIVDNDFTAKSVFTMLQAALADVGLYSVKIDGIWGSKTAEGLNTLLSHYRKEKDIPELWYAWSGHPNVPADGIRKYEEWMKKWEKPLTHVSYILSCNALETGKTFDPAIRNPKSGAIGLIQFMPKGSVPDLGTTVEALAAMTFVEQLDYVFKYFEKYGYIKKCKYLEDYYLSIFYPAHVGKDPNTVVARAGSAVYQQNIGFDPVPRRGYYTVGDIASAINQFYWDGLDPKNRIPKPQGN